MGLGCHLGLELGSYLGLNWGLIGVGIGASFKKKRSGTKTPYFFEFETLVLLLFDDNAKFEILKIFCYY